MSDSLVNQRNILFPKLLIEYHFISFSVDCSDFLLEEKGTESQVNAYLSNSDLVVAFFFCPLLHNFTEDYFLFIEDSLYPLMLFATSDIKFLTLSQLD